MTIATDELERTLEGLLFLSADPVGPDALAEATGAEAYEVGTALERLREHYEFERRGFILRELAGGWVLSTHPEVEPAARRLLARPRTPPLTPAQAETLAIVAYLQPVSRPEIARIRGVSAESAAATLLERGIIEESGRSQFGAVMYRTTELFLKLFGLQSTDELPEIEGFDPSPEFEQELRDRLMRAGEARAGVDATTPGAASVAGDAVTGAERLDGRADADDGDADDGDADDGDAEDGDADDGDADAGDADAGDANGDASDADSAAN